MRTSAVYMLTLLSFPARNRLSARVRRLLSMRGIRVLLVFGLSRSGTTFLAEALTLRNDEAIKLHEPVKKLLRLSYQGDGGRSADDEAFWGWVFESERIPWKVHLLVCAIALEALRSSERLLCIKPISMSDCVEETAAAIGGSVVFISLQRERRGNLHDGKVFLGIILCRVSSRIVKKEIPVEARSLL